MKNLLLLILRYHFFILFLIFEISAGYLITVNNKFHNAGVLNTTNAITANILKVVSDVRTYLNLRVINEKLAEENARLHENMPSSFYSEKVDTSSVKDSLYKQRYEFAAARIISNSVNHRNNYILLDKGAEHGIEPEMGVISSQGIIGIVKDVSEHFSSVISLLHKDFRTSARLRNNNYFGNLEWRGGNPETATLVDLPKHVQLAKGDTLITTAYSGIFPEGIMVGTIENFEVKSGDNFYTIEVKLSVNFYNLGYAYVVKDLLKDERKQLEPGMKND